MTWFKIELDKYQIAQRTQIDVKLQFVKECGATQFPEGLALFQPKHDATDTATYYLPPTAALHCVDLLKRFRAEPCDRPDPAGIAVASGSQIDFDFWFAGPGR